MGGGSARDLRRAAAAFRGPPHLPRLWFFTDPVRTPEPESIVLKLPHGAAVVYRHFGAADRRRTARRLARLCERRDIRLLIGADAALAEAVGADGVHLPERLAADAPLLRTQQPGWLITAAAHGASAMTDARGLDAFVLSPIYPSMSPSAGAALSLPVASRLVRMADRPVIALGGVTMAHMRDLARAGFAGAAGIEMFLE